MIKLTEEDMAGFRSAWEKLSQLGGGGGFTFELDAMTGRPHAVRGAERWVWMVEDKRWIESFPCPHNRHGWCETCAST